MVKILRKKKIVKILAAAIRPDRTRRHARGALLSADQLAPIRAEPRPNGPARGGGDRGRLRVGECGCAREKGGDRRSERTSGHHDDNDDDDGGPSQQ